MNELGSDGTLESPRILVRMMNMNECNECVIAYMYLTMVQCRSVCTILFCMSLSAMMLRYQV